LAEVECAVEDFFKVEGSVVVVPVGGKAVFLDGEENGGD
jgi:hypothetical protein